MTITLVAVLAFLSGLLAGVALSPAPLTSQRRNPRPRGARSTPPPPPPPRTR